MRRPITVVYGVDGDGPPLITVQSQEVHRDTRARLSAVSGRFVNLRLKSPL